MPRRTCRRPGWEKLADGVASVHRLVGTAYLVRRCGHPTAIWPYHGERPDGSMIISPNGRAFQTLDDAMLATEIVASGRRVVIREDAKNGVHYSAEEA
jgi:hypothetical protein